MDGGIRLEQVEGKKGLALIIAAIVVAASTVTAVLVVVRSERGIDLTVHTDKVEYDLGDPVRIHLQLKNYGFKTVNLVFGTSIIMWFGIYDSDGMLAFYAPKSALMVITEVELRPGGTRSLEYSWDQINETGEQVELPDPSTVRAFSSSYVHQSRATATFSISD